MLVAAALKAPILQNQILCVYPEIRLYDKEKRFELSQSHSRLILYYLHYVFYYLSRIATHAMNEYLHIKANKSRG